MKEKQVEYKMLNLSKNLQYSAICHAELVSASKETNMLGDPETSSGWQLLSF